MNYIPVEDIFKKADKRDPVISPDGEYISYIKYQNKSESLVCLNVKTGEEKNLVTLDDSNVIFLKWSYDNETLLFQKDFNGNENYRLYSLNIKTLKLEEHTPYDFIFIKSLSLKKNNINKVAFMMNKDNPQAHDAYVLDLSTNKIEKIFENSGSILEFSYDDDFNVTAYTVQDEEGEVDLMLYDPDLDDFKCIYKWGIDNTMLSRIIKVSKDLKKIELLDNHLNNTLSYISVNTSTKNVSVLGFDNRYDIDDVVVNSVSGEVEAFGVIKYKNTYKVLNETIKPSYDKLDDLIEGEYYVTSKSIDNKSWVIRVITNTGLVHYSLFKDKELHDLFHENEQLRKHNLSVIEPVIYKARDGVEIEGYITYPNVDNKSNLPLVINVHGGPWARDIPHYISKEVSWLSNRGFVSLNVNFRGSTGYGKKLLGLGKKQWGKTMHTDLIDAVDWAIEQGITTKENVSIFGMSYGGYAVLAGVTLTPEVFCCGVDRVGPSDVVRILEDMPPHWGVFRKSFYANVGDPKTDREDLLKISPLYHVDNIVAPLLIAQGKNDPRVKVSESDNIVKKLEEKKLDYEYLLFEDEGHVFTKDKNVFEFYNKAEKFLNKHHTK